MIIYCVSVAIFPSLQNRLEPTSLAGFSSVSPMMMFSVGSSKEQSIGPSYKMVSNLISLQKAWLWKEYRRATCTT